MEKAAEHMGSPKRMEEETSFIKHKQTVIGGKPAKKKKNEMNTKVDEQLKNAKEIHKHRARVSPH